MGVQDVSGAADAVKPQQGIKLQSASGSVMPEVTPENAAQEIFRTVEYAKNPVGALWAAPTGFL